MSKKLLEDYLVFLLQPHGLCSAGEYKRTISCGFPNLHKITANWMLTFPLLVGWNSAPLLPCYVHICIWRESRRFVITRTNCKVGCCHINILYHIATWVKQIWWKDRFANWLGHNVPKGSLTHSLSHNKGAFTFSPRNNKAGGGGKRDLEFPWGCWAKER